MNFTYLDFFSNLSKRDSYRVKSTQGAFESDGERHFLRKTRTFGKTKQTWMTGVKVSP